MTRADMVAAQSALMASRAAGVLTYRDSNGELVTYKSDRDMAAALVAIDQEIARLDGTVRPHTIHFNMSKGL